MLGAAAAVALTVLVGAAAPASASAVGDNVRAERRISREIRVLTKHARTHTRELHRAVVIAQLAGGHTDVGVSGLASAASQIAAGNLNFLATFGQERLPGKYGNVPTLIESGYVMPHWPKPWGRDASAVEQLVVDNKRARDTEAALLNMQMRRLLGTDWGEDGGGMLSGASNDLRTWRQP